MVWINVLICLSVLFTSKGVRFSDYFWSGFGFAIVVNKLQNEPHGTLVDTGTWQNLKIDTSRIKKNQVASKKPLYVRRPLLPSRLL